MRFLILFLSLFFVVKPSLAQETQKGKPDTVKGIQLFPLPEGSHIDSVLVNFAGVWVYGFETDKFIPCGNWVPDSLGSAKFIPNNIGMYGGHILDHIQQNFTLPKPPKKSQRLYLKGKGWLMGPGHYSHFDSNYYALKPIDFSEVRWARPNECKD